jgi:hypothetical protein
MVTVRELWSYGDLVYFFNNIEDVKHFSNSI